MNRRNIVLTGTGQSGTTLACHLLNKLPDTVALSEPIPPNKFVEYMPDHEAVCDQVEKYYRWTRTRARKRGVATSKHMGGVVPDNTKGMVGGVRRRIAEKGKIAIEKELRAGFRLAIKQPGLLPPCYPRWQVGFRVTRLYGTRWQLWRRPAAYKDEISKREVLLRYTGTIQIYFAMP